MEQTIPLIRLLPRTEHKMYYLFRGEPRMHTLRSIEKDELGGRKVVKSTELSVRPLVRMRFENFTPLLDLPGKSNSALFDVTLFRMDNDHYVTLGKPDRLEFSIALSLPAGEDTKAKSRALVLQVDAAPIRGYWFEMLFLGQLEFKTHDNMFTALAEAHHQIDKWCRNGTVSNEFINSIMSQKVAADCAGKPVDICNVEKVYVAVAQSSVTNEELCQRLQITGQG